MTPPPAEPLASRLLLGPVLRTQPDRRLVRLVREGYEGAFEEIVRRYRKPLDRFAASIVGSRSEDVTQDAFSKALLALRGSEQEIDLRPWLYRIVRNTALNDLRDRPPAVEQLEESLTGGPSAAIEAERREEIRDLMARLRALPEPQRAAIVMRELEGLSHEEIASALGISGGAARQTIHRARSSLRNGVGLLVPLPLLRLLFDHAGEAAGGTAAVGATGTAAAVGGLGGGGLKVGVATVLIAGSVGAGVAVEQTQRNHGPGPAQAAAATVSSDEGSGGPSGEAESGGDHGGHGAAPGDEHGSSRRSGADGGHGGGPGPSDTSGGGHHGSGSPSSGRGGGGASGGSGSSGSSGRDGGGSGGGSGPAGGGSDDLTTTTPSSGPGSGDSGSSGDSGTLDSSSGSGSGGSDDGS
jgi:RNA polymerase sigma factor (sigma-70 family)